MSIPWFAPIMLVFLPLMGCVDTGNPDVTRVEATIVALDGRFVLVADSSGTRYIPDRIPYSYREDGLKIYVSGTIGTTFERVRPQEVPLQVTSLSERFEE